MAAVGNLTDLEPKVAAQRHPLYDQFREEWIKLGHVREGTGGFLDGTYLAAHPREWLDHSAKVTTTDPTTGARVTTVAQNPNPKKPSAKLKARRAIASYTNIASAILDSKKAALFRESPTRRVGQGEQQQPSEIELWWEDVDGKGCAIRTAMPAWWDLAATFGHVVLYFELPGEVSDDSTAAEQDQPYIRVYTPLDVINWLTDDDGQIISLKVVEAVQATQYDDPAVTQYRVRIIDQQGWKLYDFKSGAAIGQGEHGLGTLPVAFLYGKRRAVLSDVGQSILGDPRKHIDLYNLESELRELLRNQTFSFINIPLGSGNDAMSVEQAQQMLGSQTGTGNVIFSGLAAQILSADASNVASYQEEIKNKIREIYREAGSPWEADSKDAEATGSLELKREELNIRLAQYADECEAAEMRLNELWYRWKHGAERGRDKMQEDQVVVQYPDKFGALPFEDVIRQVQSAQSVGMPALFMKALRKNIVTKFEGMGSLSPEQLKAILDEIENAPDDPTPQERIKQRMDIMAQAAKMGGKAPAISPVPDSSPNA